jgi:hypothetical protein
LEKSLVEIQSRKQGEAVEAQARIAELTEINAQAIIIFNLTL